MLLHEGDADVLHRRDSYDPAYVWLKAANGMPLAASGNGTMLIMTPHEARCLSVELATAAAVADRAARKTAPKEG